MVLQPFDGDLALVADTGEFAVDEVCGFDLGDVEAGAVEAFVRGHVVIFVVGVDAVCKGVGHGMEGEGGAH